MLSKVINTFIWLDRPDLKEKTDNQQLVIFKLINNLTFQSFGGE
jgi:hypothetical protein